MFAYCFPKESNLSYGSVQWNAESKSTNYIQEKKPVELYSMECKRNYKICYGLCYRICEE